MRPLAELAATDALLTALSKGWRRRADPATGSSMPWVPGWTRSCRTPYLTSRLGAAGPFTDPTTSRTWRIAATAIAVTAMSSSGIAAAATGDPLAPFNYVATALGNLAPTDRADQTPLRDAGDGLGPARDAVPINPALTPRA